VLHRFFDKKAEMTDEEPGHKGLETGAA
jgi:hypothetical protein